MLFLLSSVYQLKVLAKKLLLPLISECIPAGFPSPAENYIDSSIDLNEELIRNPASTFFLRVQGESMSNAGILDGDLLIVDRSLEPQSGHIVVAILNGCFTLKQLTYRKNVPYLEAAHPNYSALDLRHYENVEIWGVAIYAVHSLSQKYVIR